MQTYSIHNNKEASRFETQIDGHLAKLDYQVHGGMLQIDFVYVPTEIGGRGIGGALVNAAAEWAKQEGMKINPICGFARRYLEKNPGI